MAGMWRLYGQAVGSILHPVRTIRDFASGVLPVARAASLRPHEAGVALRERGVDLAAIFRLAYWAGILETIVTLFGIARAEPFAGVSPVVLGVVLVLMPLLVALIYAAFLPIWWYWIAFSLRLGFRAVAPWMSWQQAREVLFVFLLPHLALWAIVLSLLLGIAGIAVAPPEGAAPAFRPPVLAVSVVNALFGLFLFIQSVRLVRAFRDLTIWRTLGGLILSFLVAALPFFVLTMAAAVVVLLNRPG